MKPFKIDVPVLLFVFIRPDNLKVVFETIKKVRPSTLFLVSDGPRKDILSDKINIKKSRDVVKNIDWECQVHKLYFDENQGMYTTFNKALEFVFQKVDRCIFLEDDVVPAEAFFHYCAELLEKYKEDLRVNRICGMNHMGVYDEVDSDYFFSRTGSIWGFAIWKRSYNDFYNLSYSSSQYSYSRIKENSRKYSKFIKYLDGYAENPNFNGHIPGPEFFLGLSSYSQNQLAILPKKNMICNIGYGEGNTHFSDDLRKLPQAVQKMFNMRVYEIDFPLKHPDFLIEDKHYEDLLYRIMGRSPYVKISRKIEGIVRRILFKDYKTIFKTIFKKRNSI